MLDGSADNRDELGGAYWARAQYARGGGADAGRSSRPLGCIPARAGAAQDVARWPRGHEVQRSRGPGFLLVMSNSVRARRAYASERLSAVGEPLWRKNPLQENHLRSLEEVLSRCAAVGWAARAPTLWAPSPAHAPRSAARWWRHPLASPAPAPCANSLAPRPTPHIAAQLILRT